MANLLGGMNSNAKTIKGLDAAGIEGVILYLAAADSVSEALGKQVTVCPWADGCEKPCLVGAGRGRMSPVQKGRQRKTLLFFQDRPAFMAQLRRELGSLVKRAAKKGLQATARLDGTSDLGLDVKLAPEFPAIQFYGYTKSEKRVMDWLKGTRGNRHYTFSRSAGNWDACQRVLEAGGNVAVVSMAPRPEAFSGFPTVDGDAHDFRFLDPPGTEVWLKAKGTKAMLADGLESGFILPGTENPDAPIRFTLKIAA